MSILSGPEQAPSALKSVETQKLIVRQPTKLAELNTLLSTFENLSARVGERVGEDNSGDMGGGGSMTGTTGGQQGDDDTAVSPRDIAISKIPSSPQAVRLKLKEHIHTEVRNLEKQARREARSGKPGTAYQLNEIYARIHRLNALLHEIFEASYDALKRLFIRVFIDQQPIL